MMDVKLPVCSICSAVCTLYTKTENDEDDSQLREELAFACGVLYVRTCRRKYNAGFPDFRLTAYDTVPGPWARAKDSKCANAEEVVRLLREKEKKS
jgi:hypothetical protein